MIDVSFDTAEARAVLEAIEQILEEYRHERDNAPLVAGEAKLKEALATYDRWYRAAGGRGEAR